MSDGFERSVREAAAKLGEPGAAPSYHRSWQRGLRRRYTKRAAMAGLGFAAFAAVLVVDVDRLPGRDSFETDDVAVSANAIPADTGDSSNDGSGLSADESQTAVATTEPIQVGPAASGSTDGASATTPNDEVAVPGTTATATPTPAGASVPTPTLTPLPAVPVAPVPTSTPARATAASPTSTPVASPADPTATADAAIAATAVPGVTPDPSTTDPNDTVSPTPTVTAGETPAITSVPTPLASFTRPADAVVLGSEGFDTEQACATVLEGMDSSCKLLRAYACKASEVSRPDYQAVDSTGDGIVNECVPAVETYCDLTGDGVGDAPCTISPLSSTSPVEPGAASD